MGIALRIECPCVRLVRRAKLAKDEKETCLMNVGDDTVRTHDV